MRNFWTYITNGQFSIGCMEHTVYLYDNEKNEIAKFKDIKYGSKAVFSPINNTFVVKSTGAYFAVYSADKAALLHKVKFSNVDGSQDDGFCFSPDGKYFINIERQKSSVNHAISVYETENFTRLSMMYADDQKTEPTLIEFGDDGKPYVLGFLRGDNGVFCSAFVAVLGENGLEEMRTVNSDEYEFHSDFKKLQMHGFTEKAKKWSGFTYKNIDMTGMENEKHPFKDLWEKTN